MMTRQPAEHLACAPDAVSRRRLLVGLTGLAGALSLAACGGGTARTATAGTATAQQSNAVALPAASTVATRSVSTAVQTGVATLAARSSGSTTVAPTSVSAVAKANAGIRFSFFGDKNEQAIWEKIAQQYSATSGVPVTTEPIPSNYFTKIQTELAGGVGADAILMEDKPTSGYAKNGVFHELDSFIAADHTFKMDDFYTVLFDGLKYHGKLYGLPQHWLTQSIAYNKQLFRAAGIPFPALDWKDPSWNWNTFLDAAQKLTVTSNGKTTQWGFPLTGYSWTRWRMWVWQNGGEVLSPDLKQCVLGTSEATEGLQFYADLPNIHHVGPTPDERKAANNADDPTLFSQSKAAMIATPPYFFDLRSQIKDIDWDIAPMPMQKKRAAPLWPDSISMNAATKASDAAWGLLRYVVSKEGQTTITTLGRGVPVLKSVANSPAFLQTDKQPASIASYLDLPQYGVVTQYTTVWTDMEKANSEELTPVFLGQRTAKDGVTRLVPRINTLLQGAEVG
ncbi:MAG TPA: sugar ABC transporter substrate-binding protein [Chloroflexota bacterium]|jgi:multiple sugar transport system substrate-binding protein|nr:sugar ABC transporter substrate-binding protein [Chloroflexota bacterium]